MPEDEDTLDALRQSVEELKKELADVPRKIKDAGSEMQARIDFLESELANTMLPELETGNESFIPAGREVEWIYCEKATSEAKPPEWAVTRDGKSIIQRPDEVTIRTVWDVKWNYMYPNCLEYSYAYLTFKGGRLVKIDTGARGNADHGHPSCCEPIVCAVDCEDTGGA
jgi:hypothetical protein